jgi:hypothetical protein
MPSSSVLVRPATCNYGKQFLYLNMILGKTELYIVNLFVYLFVLRFPFNTFKVMHALKITSMTYKCSCESCCTERHVRLFIVIV